MVCLSKFQSFGLRKNNSKHRTGLEIVADVLSVVTVKARKTRIMYQTNLSYRLVEKYLGSLLERGLLVCGEDSCYSITGRGEAFLKRYNDYLERCKGIGESIDEARKDRISLENMCFNDDCAFRRLNSKGS